MAKAKHPHTNDLNKYARDVVKGKVLACKWVKLAAERHLNDLERAKQKSFPYKFDPAKVEEFVNFAELMPHVKGEWAGSNIKFEPWQKFCLGVPFGWVRKADGFRRYREVYLEIPRKNSKSTIGAVVGNYMLSADEEPGAEVYSGATTEKQAWEVFRPARLMALRADGYSDYFGVDVGAKNMSILAQASRFEPIIGNPGDGSSPHCALVDEYHEHPTARMYDTMVTGMGARRQPMLIVITTAGTNTSYPCYDKHLQAKKILEGVVDNPELWAVIYTVDEDDDWTDFKVWKKANPNYGVSVYQDYLKARYNDAMQNANRQNVVRCKHLNQWMNAGTSWMNMQVWHKQAKPGMCLEDFKGQPCYAALDLASKIDVLGRCLLFEDGANLYAFGRYYLPSETVWKAENTHYQKWVAEGWLTETDGARTDMHRVEEDLQADNSIYPIRALAFDPREASYLIEAVSQWLGGDRCVEVNQGPAHISEPMKELEARIYDGRFWFNGDPVMTWMMSNVIKKQGQGGGPVKSYYPTKDRDAAKIDIVVCLIMAVKMAMAFEEEPASYTAEHGVMVL